jgi:N utilization substance protein A
MNVLLDDHLESGKTGTVIVPDRQLSLAIGKEGQNARLAAKLTGWRIDIKSASEAAEETLGRLEIADIPQEDMDLLTLAETMLRRGDTDALSKEEEAKLVAGLEDGLEWPEEEPVVEAEAVEALEAEAKEGAVAAAPVGAEAEEAVADAEAPAGAEAEELAELSPEDAALEPTFEGEPIEDSLGWVSTESQEDLYDGWEGVDSEDEVEAWLPELDSEALWEQEELPDEPKTKKKKKKARSGYGTRRRTETNMDERGRW